MIKFLKDIIIPGQIGNYYLVPQRILGLDITKTGISAAQVYYTGTTITLEKFINIPLENDASKPYAQRVVQALKATLKQADHYDSLRISLPSSHVVFKELILPFEDPEKISLVLNYELEPYLPFPISQAVADFITIQSDPETKKATILAAAVKKEYLQEYLSYFQQAEADPAIISVDLFDLYSLFKFIPTYAQEKKAICLLEMGHSSTRIAYIFHGKLYALRTLAKGISHITKELAQKLSITNAQAHEKILRFGCDVNSDEAYNAAIKEILNQFLKEISFTFESFITKYGAQGSIEELLLLGPGAEIPGIANYIQTTLHINSALFDSNALLKNTSIKIPKIKSIARENIMSLATALITPVIQSFNLRQQEFACSQIGIFTKQFFVAIGLIICLFGMLIGHSFWQIKKLSSELTKSEKEIISIITKTGLTQEKTLRRALDDAQTHVEEQEGIWFAFSSQTRFPFLKYLEKLSTGIDRVSVGLKLDKLIISEKENTITLEGQVKDFDALKILERELKKMTIFSYVPSLQTIKFNITIPLIKNREDL